MQHEKKAEQIIYHGCIGWVCFFLRPEECTAFKSSFKSNQAVAPMGEGEQEDRTKKKNTPKNQTNPAHHCPQKNPDLSLEQGIFFLS